MTIFKKLLALTSFICLAALIYACDNTTMPSAGSADIIPIKVDTISTPTPTPTPKMEPTPTQADGSDPSPSTIYKFDDVEIAKGKLQPITGDMEFETRDTGMGYIDYAKLPGSKHEGVVELRYYPNGILAEAVFVLKSGEMIDQMLPVVQETPVETSAPDETAPPEETLPNETLPIDDVLPEELTVNPNAQKLASMAEEFEVYVRTYTGKATSDNLADELWYAYKSQHEPREITAGKDEEAINFILSYYEGEFRLNI